MVLDKPYLRNPNDLLVFVWCLQQLLKTINNVGHFQFPLASYISVTML